MTSFSHKPITDFRNEGWTFAGAFATLNQCWSSTSDTNYCACPASKGRACCSFPIDVTTVPAGAVITSVVIQVRCAKTTSAAVSLTVNMSCTDDTSRFTSRTIYPTSTPTTYTVGTYSRDPLGYAWDVHRLNKLLLQCFTYTAVGGCVNVYELYAVVNYRAAAVVTVTGPTGTVLTPSPTVTWTYAQPDGDLQTSADYRVFTAIQAADPSFSPDTAPPVYAATVTGDIVSDTLPTSLDPDNYAVYVRVVSSSGAVSPWASRSFSVDGPAPGVPGNDNTVSGVPGIGVVSVVPDAYTSSVALTLRDSSNLLSVQQADFETLTDALEYTTANAVMVQDTSVSYAGVASGRLTASSAATMSASSTMVPIAAGAPVTVRSQFLAAATGRTINIRCLFYDMNFSSVSGTLTGTGTDSTSTWTEITATGTVPAAAVWAAVQLEVVSPANAEIHNVDHVGLMYGTNSLWSDGGHASRNILSSFLATGDSPTATSWVASSGSTIALVATTGTGSHGTSTNRITYTGITPSIGYRATGTVFTTPTSGSDYTLNTPAGVVATDLMIAYVTSSVAGSITPPAGWTLVDTATSSGTTLWVLARSSGGGEPSSYAGVVGTVSTRREAVVVAYSGAADVSQQFLAENVSSRSTPTPLYATTATVANTDPNAWRVAAFAVASPTTGGSMTANILPPSVVPPIAYVGRATAWGSTATTTSYTINRPSGVVSGDLMIAVLSVFGSITTVNAPSGWTLVHQKIQSDGTGPQTMAVFKRTAGSSEPTSWTGVLSSSSTVAMLSEASAYRNADVAANQFLAENVSATNNSDFLTTATVTNTNSSAWRVSIFGASAIYTPTWGVSETAMRSNDWVQQDWTWYEVAVALADSNGPVGAGAQSGFGEISRSFYAAVSWMGFIKPLPSPPSPGANETERADTTVGSATPWVTTAVYDSNGVVPTGNTSVTGVFTPGSGSVLTSAASWIGIIRPATPITAGLAKATLPASVDLSKLDPNILVLGGNQATFVASFLGSSSGTPYLSLSFYRANELISTATAQGTPFSTTLWTASAATFTVPDGTTRISGSVSVSGRAVSDLIYFDRIGIMIGDAVVWRNGTGRTAHAVWSVPVIQYADDPGTGYGDWTVLPGFTDTPPSYDPLSGLITVIDHTVVPLTNRRYRAQTVAYGLAGDQFVSGYGPTSDEVSLVASNWWLKDMVDPDSNMMLRVQANPLAVGTTNTSSVYQPLGADYPVVLTEGYKADSFQLTLVMNHAEYFQLKALLKLGRTLFLQSDVDHAWWVRPNGDLSGEIQVTGQRRTNPVRFVKVTFTEVTPNT